MFIVDFTIGFVVGLLIGALLPYDTGDNDENKKTKL